MKKNPDHFYHKAKKDGFAARSVFKLEELDRKYHLIRKGDHVLDLGAAPGSWLKYLSQRVGKSGKVVGVDLEPLREDPPKEVLFFQQDLFALTPEILKGYVSSFHVVVSDAAPQTTGSRDTDHLKSVAICEFALELAIQLLPGGGHFVCKMYQGGETHGFLKKLKDHFLMAKIQKPSASRKESREIFFVGREFQK